MNRLLFLAAAAMTLAACNSEMDDDPNVEIRLRSGLDVQQTDTRAAAGIQSKQFDNGEKIDVYITENTTGTASTTYDQPLVYSTTDNAGAMSTTTQPYFPTSGNGVNIYAVYPSGTSVADNNTFTIKEDQSTKIVDDQSSDANYKASDLMYGAPADNATVTRTKNAVTIKFKHLLSKVTVTLVPGNGSPNLTGAVVKLKDVKPSTTLTASISGGSVSDASGDTKDITVMKATADALSGSAVIVPQTLSTSFIEVTLADGGVLTSTGLSGSGNTALNEVKLETGKAYTYKITVNLTGLNVTSSISDWDSTSGEVNGSAEMPDPA